MATEKGRGMSKNKVSGKGVKTFEIELKELSLPDREEIMNQIYDPDVAKNFSFHLSVIRKSVDLSDDELNKYSNEELYAISNEIIDSMSKKK